MGQRYAPSQPPQADSLEELRSWLLQELRTIGTITQSLAAQQVDETFAPPAKPRSGMVVLADGTRWNPGSGRGYYGYDEITATWRFLG